MTYSPGQEQVPTVSTSAGHDSSLFLSNFVFKAWAFNVSVDAASWSSELYPL